MKFLLLILCFGVANLVPAQQISGVFHQTADTLVYADKISQDDLESTIKDWKAVF